MRLICPSCGAQYEVDDTLIPDDGRDVQCSSCGTGWFQRPHHPSSDLADDLGTDPELTPAFADDEDEDGTLPPEDEVPRKPSNPGRIDATVRSILMEEAAREARARRGEPLLETQPELGIDPWPHAVPGARLPDLPKTIRSEVTRTPLAEPPPRAAALPDAPAADEAEVKIAATTQHSGPQASFPGDLLAEASAASGPIPPASRAGAAPMRSEPSAASTASDDQNAEPVQIEALPEASPDAPADRLSERPFTARDLNAGAEEAELTAALRSEPAPLPADPQPSEGDAPRRPDHSDTAAPTDPSASQAEASIEPPSLSDEAASAPGPSFMATLQATPAEPGDVATAESSPALSPAKPAMPTAAPSRRDLLPDIEEINSSLHSAGTDPHQSIDEAPARRGGFSLGFMTVLIIALIAVLIYAFAPQIGRTMPALEPGLTSYVTAIDSLRIWLDSTVRGLITSLRGA